MANLVTNLGLANITAALNAYASRPRYLQWGTGSGKTAVSTNVTTASTTEDRTAGTTSQQTDAVADDTYQVQGTITALGTRAITEVGVFDAAGAGSPPAGGNMDIVGDFAVINLDAGDSITFTVAVKFS